MLPADAFPERKNGLVGVQRCKNTWFDWLDNILGVEPSSSVIFVMQIVCHFLEILHVRAEMEIELIEVEVELL